MSYNKRNYLMLFLDPVLFVSGMAFLSVNAVIPNFLNELGASAFQISLASALASIGALATQPIFAQLAMGMPVKNKFFAKLITFQRLLFLAYIPFIPLISKLNPMLSVILFLTLWGIFNLFVGSYSPFYMSILAKIIPGNQRGRLIGFATSTGNILALGSALLIGVLLKKLSFPYNYTWIFSIGIFLLLLNACTFALIQEKPDDVKRKPVNYLKYIVEIPRVFKTQKIYALSVLGNSFLVISNVALAFYSIAAIRMHQAGPEQVALFTAIGIIVTIFGSIVFGLIGDRAGHINVLAIAGTLSASAAAITLIFPTLLAINIGFALSSLSACAYSISNGINILENSPNEQVPLYSSINVMITLIASSLVTIAGGAIIDIFSFLPLFFFTGACGVAASVTFRIANGKKQILRRNR